MNTTPLDPDSPRGMELAADLAELLATFELNIRNRRRAATPARPIQLRPTPPASQPNPLAA